MKFLYHNTCQLHQMSGSNGSCIMADSDGEDNPYKNISQVYQKEDLAPYSSQIKNLSHQNITYYLSYATIHERFSIFSTKCFLVIKKNQKDDCQIGYVEKVAHREFPVKWAEPFFTNSSSLKYASQFTAVVDDKLSIKFFKRDLDKQQTIYFAFQKKDLINQWVDLISKLNSGQYDKQKQLERAIMQQKERLIEQNKNMQAECKRIQEEYKRMQAEKQLIQSDYKEMMQRMDQKLKKQQQDTSHLISQMDNLKRSYQQSCADNQRLNIQLTRLGQSLTNAQSKNIELEEKLKEMNHASSQKQAIHNEQVHSMQRAIQSLQSNAQLLQQNLSSSRKQHQVLIEQLESKKKKILVLKKEIQDVRNQYKTMTNLYQKKHQQYQQSLQLIQHLTARIRFKSLQPLFYNLLEDCPQQKQFLVSQIQGITERQIKKTKLLFSYDPQNKKNFHHYIDGHPNIVIIVKTANGSLIAAYSQQSVHPATANGQPTGKYGLLASLSNKISFPLYEGKKSVSYDEYYLIFGNAELQIKAAELKLFSNFGIKNGYFNAKGCGIKQLFGEGSLNEIEMQSYEIYKIIFVQ